MTGWRFLAFILFDFFRFFGCRFLLFKNTVRNSVKSVYAELFGETRYALSDSDIFRKTKLGIGF